MTPSEDIVAFRRTAAIGAATRFALMAVVLTAAAMLIFAPGSGYLAAGMFALASGVYLYLAWKSLGVSRRALIGPELLARGQAEEAERVFTAAVRAFTLFPSHRAVELVHLAQLRQQQGRHADAEMLTREVLGLRGRVPPELELTARLLQLESLLELRSYAQAHQAILGLMPMSLTMTDAARLVLARTRYESAIGADGHVLHGLGMKLMYARLLPPDPHARFCLLSAAAAGRCGRSQLAGFLLARARALTGDRFDRVYVYETAVADTPGIAVAAPVAGDTPALAGPVK